MKQNKTNYRLYFNFLLLTGLVVFFSSCARERSSLSYNNEKLRKQSLEIENSQNTPSHQVAAPAKIQSPEQAAVKNETAASVNKSERKVKKSSENNSLTNPLAIGQKSDDQKISPLQKMVAKKIAKKLDSNKSAALDQQLKYAIIFGAVAIILFILDSFIPFFWILGAISLVVAIVFLLLWVLAQ